MHKLFHIDWKNRSLKISAKNVILNNKKKYNTRHWKDFLLSDNWQCMQQWRNAAYSGMGNLLELYNKDVAFIV